MRQGQFECFQRELELVITPKIEEKIKQEKQIWEQEQKCVMQKELVKLREEKARELVEVQKQLSLEKEKAAREWENVAKLEIVLFVVALFDSISIYKY